ncbi:197_t:CDS:1, partial [Funneliformis geosporum]
EKTKKSTYFDKYKLNGSFTKAVKNQSIPKDFEEILDDMKNEEKTQLDLNKRIKNLKIELKE